MRVLHSRSRREPLPRTDHVEEVWTLPAAVRQRRSVGSIEIETFSGSSRTLCPGGFGDNMVAIRRFEGDYSCNGEVQKAIPVLKKAYGHSMHKVLHVGPDTCSVVSKLLKEEEIEVWGIEPYDVEAADAFCKCLVRKGIVRVADIRFPLPYRSKSFDLIVVSDAFDYLTPRYLNKTLPDLARVSSDGLVIFSGNPAQQREADVSKFGRTAKLRSSDWWARYFLQTNFEENEVAIHKFMQAAAKMSFNPNCQVFHLKSFI